MFFHIYISFYTSRTGISLFALLGQEFLSISLTETVIVPFDISPKLLKSIRGISSLHSSSKDWANITEILGFDRARETRPIRSAKFPLNSPITQTSTKFRGIFSSQTNRIH